MAGSFQTIDANATDHSIRLLKEYATLADIGSVASLLEALKDKPAVPLLHQELARLVYTLGLMKGAVLTCAPQVMILLSDDSYEFT